MTAAVKTIALILRERLNESRLLETMQAICSAHKVRLEDLLGGTKSRTVARARREACWVLRTKHKFSFPEIGRTLGINHSTAIHAVQAYEKQLEKEKGDAA